MAAPLTYPREDIKSALVAAHGNYSAAAKMLEMSRQRFVDRVIQDPELVAMKEDFVQQRLDTAENVIDAALDAGDTSTARWVLSTQGKDRGFTTRQEHSDPDGEPLGSGAMERLAAKLSEMNARLTGDEA